MKKKEKEILVKDILNIMSDEQKVVCHLYAYGVFYGSTQNDGMVTVAECKDQMNYDCINAKVAGIREENGYIVISGEIVH